MKCTLRPLPLLGTMVLALTACEGHLTPKTPETQAQTTGIGDTAQSTDAATGPLTGSQGSSSSMDASSTSPESTTSTSAPEPSTSSPDSSTSSTTESSTPTESSFDDSQSSSDTGPIVVPAPYAGQNNPLDTKDTGVIVAGGLRFKKNCGCHVADSQNHDTEAPDLGRGESSKRADDWLMWRISEGVAPKMGPFKDTFNETERWQIISYLRALTIKNENGG